MKLIPITESSIESIVLTTSSQALGYSNCERRGGTLRVCRGNPLVVHDCHWEAFATSHMI